MKKYKIVRVNGRKTRVKTDDVQSLKDAALADQFMSGSDALRRIAALEQSLEHANERCLALRGLLYHHLQGMIDREFCRVDAEQRKKYHAP